MLACCVLLAGECVRLCGCCVLKRGPRACVACVHYGLFECTKVLHSSKHGRRCCLTGCIECTWYIFVFGDGVLGIEIMKCTLSIPVALVIISVGNNGVCCGLDYPPLFRCGGLEYDWDTFPPRWDFVFDLGFLGGSRSCLRLTPRIFDEPRGEIGEVYDDGIVRVFFFVVRVFLLLCVCAFCFSCIFFPEAVFDFETLAPLEVFKNIYISGRFSGYARWEDALL